MAQHRTEESISLRQWQDADVRLYRAYCSEVPEDGICGSFQPHYLTAWRILAGKVVVDSPTGALTAQPGQWLFLPDTPRAHIIDPGTRMISIHYRFHWPDDRSVFQFQPGLRIEASASGCLDETAKELSEYVWALFQHYPIRIENEALDFDQFWRLRQLFSSWIMAAIPLWQSSRSFWNLPTRMDPRAIRVRQWLDGHPIHVYPAWEKAADLAGLSVVQLGRVFANTYHLSPARYFDSRRFHYARVALMNPATSIKEVASELGFRHLSKFSNWFTRHAGRSPSAYQKLHFL